MVQAVLERLGASFSTDKTVTSMTRGEYPVIHGRVLTIDYCCMVVLNLISHKPM